MTAMGLSEFMELIVLGGFVLLIISFVFSLDHRKRLRDVEKRLEEAERELQRRGGEQGAPDLVPPAPEQRTSALKRAREEDRFCSDLLTGIANLSKRT